MPIQETESPIISSRYESPNYHYVMVGLSPSAIKGLIEGALAECVLANGDKCRIWSSTLKTRAVDARMLASDAKVALALRPDHLKMMLTRPMCHELVPGCRWPATKTRKQLRVVFCFFNRTRLHADDVLREAVSREGFRESMGVSEEVNEEPTFLNGRSDLGGQG